MQQIKNEPRISKRKKIYLYGFLILTLLIIGILSFFAYKRWQLAQPPLKITAIEFKELTNWQSDSLVEAWVPFTRSCQRIIAIEKDTIFMNGSRASDWQPVCSLALQLKNPTDAEIRNFFETQFTPYKVTTKEGNEGLFTGYYEPQVKGSRTKSEDYNAALYKRPEDLVMIEDLGLFRKDLKGIRIAGKVVQGNLRPYYTHAEIDNGALKGNELLWVSDDIEAFFVQIQGSANVKLDTGDTTRLAYAGTNGHTYTPIGRVLIEKKLLKKEEVSMQSIRAWLKEHPEQAKEIMQKNASFVFFTEVNGEGPFGAQGVALTPGRSLAIDPVFISYGTPIWLDIDHPTQKEKIQRLVIAQDKGGAIKGPIRGDFFFGTGDEAGELAGLMKSKGTFYLLLPKMLSPNKILHHN